MGLAHHTAALRRCQDDFSTNDCNWMPFPRDIRAEVEEGHKINPQTELVQTEHLLRVFIHQVLTGGA
jgi:hypothetical protein